MTTNATEASLHCVCKCDDPILKQVASTLYSAILGTSMQFLCGTFQVLRQYFLCLVCLSLDKIN